MVPSLAILANKPCRAPLLRMAMFVTPGAPGLSCPLVVLPPVTSPTFGSCSCLSWRDSAVLSAVVAFVSAMPADSYLVISGESLPGQGEDVHGESGEGVERGHVVMTAGDQLRSGCLRWGEGETGGFPE